MSTLLSPYSDAQTDSPSAQRSVARAFLLVLRLQLTRRRNRLSGAPRARIGRALIRCSGQLWLLAVICWQSWAFFDGLAKARGGANLTATASLLAAVTVAGAMLLGISGEGHAASEDAEWLSTLPAPSWVLRVATIVERACFSPLAWSLLVPFFMGLALRSGAGIWGAPLAVAASIPATCSAALMGGLSFAIRHRLRAHPVYRWVGLMMPLAGTSLVLLWGGQLAVDGVGRLSGSDTSLDTWRFLDSWAETTAARWVSWSPLGLPGRALAALSTDTRGALALLALYLAQMAGLSGLALMGLRRAYHSDLASGFDRAGRSGQRSARPASESARRVSAARWQMEMRFAVIAQEARALLREPWQIARLILAAVLFHAVALVVCRFSDVALGTVVLGVGTALLLPTLAISLERERQVLPQWASLPRSVPWMLAQKVLFASAVCLVGALPAGAYASLGEPHPLEALASISRGGLSLVLLAHYQAALWLRTTTVGAAPSQSRVLASALQLLVLAALAAAVLVQSDAPRVLWWTLAMAFTAASWCDSMRRLPFVLDPSAPRARSLSAVGALLLISALRFVQAQVAAVGADMGDSPHRAQMAALAAAVTFVLLPSLVWLRVRVGRGLRASLGLSRGRGLGFALREGLIWSLPAIALLLVWTLALSQSAAAPPAPEGVMHQLQGSPARIVFVGCIAAPLVEEILFRGMLFRSLRSGWPLLPSLVVSVAVFAVDHAIVGVIPVCGLAVCATLAFERTRSLFAAMLTHAIYNGVVAWISLSG